MFWHILFVTSLIFTAPICVGGMNDQCDSVCQLVNAVKLGDSKRVGTIFETKLVSPDSLLPSGRHVSALLMLSENNDVSDVLLRYNTVIDDLTLVECVTNGKWYIVKNIIEKGLSSDEAKGVALAQAVMLMDVDSVKILLSHTASVFTKDYFGKSALDYVNNPGYGHEKIREMVKAAR